MVEHGANLAQILVCAGFLGAVLAVTLAERDGLFPLSAVAATPDGVWDGRLWLLVTSAPVAQSPLVLSLLSLAAVVFIVLKSCGSRVLLLSALVGHTGSTLVIYAAIGLLALADRDTVTRLLTEPDWGVSAISRPGWERPAAARGWLRRDGTRAEKLSIVVVCVGAGLVAWLVRHEPTPSWLDTEHVVAFAIGAALAAAPLRRRRELTST